MPDNDVKVIANFARIRHNVIYNINDATGATPIQAPLPEDEEFTVADLTGITPPPYHNFRGWSKTADGSGEIFALGSTVTMPGHDITLYAIWYLRHHNLDVTTTTGGILSYDSTPSGDYGVGTSITLTAIPTPSDRYYFAGWEVTGITLSDEAIKNPILEFDMPDNNVTVVANFARIRHNITYNIGYATGETPTQASIPEDYEFEVADTTYIIPPPRHIFVEWNTNPDGTGTSFDPGDTVTMPGHSLTLYAIWLEVFAVTYNLNGATGTAPTQTPVPEGTEITVAEIEGIIPPADSLFLRWNTEADGTGTAFNPGDIITIETYDITLYAIWVPREVCVVIDLRTWQSRN
jgi:hypothetical protein